MTVPDPPVPCAPAVETLAEAAGLFRVHGNTRGAMVVNASELGSSRFAFFRNTRSEIVPVVYAAATEAAAVAEALRHDVPLTGGVLTRSEYAPTVMNRVVTARPLRLAQFPGLGLRKLGVDAAQLSDTDRSEYRRTVLWAAAHADPAIDGISWMSARCNSDRAYVLFGDRVGAHDLAVDPDFARVFADTAGTAWLSDLCAPLRVDVLTS